MADAMNQIAGDPQCSLIDEHGEITVSWPAHRIGDTMICLASEQPRTREQDIKGGAVFWCGLLIVLVVVWLVVRSEKLGGRT